MSFEARGRTFTGCTVESYGITAAGLGADAVGINCSLGPKEILPFAQRLCRVVPAGMPVFVKPNAGLPNLDGSYDITPAEFAAEMAAYLPTGISMLGGCCGSEPESIRLLKELTQDKTPAAKTPIVRSRLCTPVRCVEVNGITVVGERINPTGKKRLQQALREGDSAYACAQAVAQAEAGAELLDVNAGLPDIDEPATLEMLVRELQSITDLPLQLDSSNKDALARALRIYNGKPIVNSVNGEQKVLDSILPLCKKYGAAVVGLALDEHGIPKTAEGRNGCYRHSPRGCLHRLPDADGFCRAERRCRNPESHYHVQKGTGRAHRAGCFQHQLWFALPRLYEYHFPDVGHAGRAGPCHHEPQHAGNDGRRARLPCADQPGRKVQ